MAELPEGAYQLPAYIVADRPELQEVHTELVRRLRADASHAPMGTVLELLLERIATNYIIIRWRESAPLGAGAFEHSTAAKEYNAFWLAMVKEFSAQVKATDADYRDALLQQVNGAISSALAGMHEDVAAPLRERFAEAFDRAGL
jgi:hypothetical protein